MLWQNKTKQKKKKKKKKQQQKKKKKKKTRGPLWPCNAHLSNIALWEPGLDLIKANILIKVQNNYINK